jgi:quercetin dioxygenase-like cupin family protein
MQNIWSSAGALRTAMAAGVCAGALYVAGSGFAQEEGTEIIVNGYEKTVGSERAWMESPSIPSGARMLLVYGDPKQPGPYIFRVKLPAGYKLPAHKHPDQRTVTVLQGTYWSGLGEKYEQDKLQKFGPGSFYITEAGVAHFAYAETEVIVQEMGVGPIGDPIEYVSSADDPRKK